VKFYDSGFNTGSLNGWNVAKVTSMEFMVSSCVVKNSYVSGQLVSANPICVKFLASAFNTGSLNGWNVAKVTNMDDMVRFHVL
jgi:hypothetical protein